MALEAAAAAAATPLPSNPAGYRLAAAAAAAGQREGRKSEWLAEGNVTFASIMQF